MAVTTRRVLLASSRRAGEAAKQPARTGSRQDEEVSGPRCGASPPGGIELLRSSGFLFLHPEEEQLISMFVLPLWNGLHIFPEMFNKSRREDIA